MLNPLETQNLASLSGALPEEVDLCEKGFEHTGYWIALSLCTFSLKAELWGERNLFLEEFGC